MAAQLPIPVYTSLETLYADLGTATNHAARWNDLAEEFQKRFGRRPTHIARAPGRVNLIGEHIDYALFGVLPAAIERDILIACAPRDPSLYPRGDVNAHNLHHKYTPQSFTPTKKRSNSIGSGPPEEEVHVEEWHLDIDKKELRWESYVKAGYYGVLNRFFPTSATELEHPIPVDLLVTGTVPAGSGLSSSAAMVVASTLVFLAANDKLDGVTKGTLVEMSMENEKRVGVNSGGMDQAASVISTPASALYVTFYPRLAATPVALPGSSASSTSSPRAVFILANSLVTSEKAVHARTRYNLRVVETLAAARILALHLGLSVGPRERLTLRQVVGRLGQEPEEGWAEDDESLRTTLRLAVKEVERLRPASADQDGQEGVTLEEMVKLSGMPKAEFREVYLDWIDVEATHFQLYKRAKHVFTEALRVLQFREVCARQDADDALKELGDLMNASQTSCSRDFDCSCAELDQLTKIARDAGAYGSRLTGAGWGGCTVSLIAEDNVSSFIEKLTAAYPPYNNLKGDALSEVIFATKPSSGACGMWLSSFRLRSLISPTTLSIQVRRVGREIELM
ncbi:galactokinase gal [Auriscalpium vulgare]|uniref:Galactokinase gal n=1 Tax=Auriscalpium vulgare TaxID=40419 RepID=A0ACB8S7R4_9AGAM|nr:galactokinase gal [Auriscalpium vulgare]